MKSVVEELLEKIAAETPGGGRSPARGGRSVARADLGMLLYAEREALDVLWKAADAAVRAAPDGNPDLAAAVERLRPLFGPRG